MLAFGKPAVLHSSCQVQLAAQGTNKGRMDDFKNGRRLNWADYQSYAITKFIIIPGRYETFWKELDYVKKLLKNRQELKTEDVGIAALFGLECFAWFCAGEIVGRGFTLTGYKA
ncbi:hypothetical protein RJ639_020049 [Escallonia herrerae]|uniref:Uncharacterized protein n=1 Tax=Escallonia herrerae TaxID=1293975 RepID=A0AA88VDA5_9ASTE|nr:hypothetical protein RJ639_020049 [Escallonia herrerae]